MTRASSPPHSSRPSRPSRPLRGPVPMVNATQSLPRSRRHTRRVPTNAGPHPHLHSRVRGRWRFFLWGMLLALVACSAAVLILGLLIERQSSLDEAAPSDAIIVLGAAQWNGTPSPVLQARLDHAYTLWTRKIASTIIVTGGKGEGDTYSEGQVARQYLVTRGVPAAAVLTEEQGRTSYESMVGAATLMQRRGWQRATVVSDPFHMLRLTRMGDDLGLQTFTSPTRTSPILPGSDTEWLYKLREIVTLAYYLIART